MERLGKGELVLRYLHSHNNTQRKRCFTVTVRYCRFSDHSDGAGPFVSKYGSYTPIYWVFGEQFCDTWVACDVMCSTASILNLCAISLDRYIHIKDPLRYGRWVTRRVAVATIAMIWLLAGLVSFLPISLGLHRPDEEALATQKPPRYPTCALVLTPTYAVVSSCISFILPCIVMISIYCRLYCYAQKHVKSIRAVTRTVQMPDNRTKSVRTRVHTHVHSSPYHVSDHKAAITVGIIMGVFLLCWVPFFCVNIVAAFCKTCIPDHFTSIPYKWPVLTKGLFSYGECLNFNHHACSMRIGDFKLIIRKYKPRFPHNNFLRRLLV
uniref:SFRICE_035186 n=1 Tax=Spodoptera frugiperda TaxID=7108 RepID=A0A2H1WLZ1_SPOFR